MFVGSSNIDTIHLRKIFKDIKLVKEYSNSLIPKEFKHIQELQDNQLYLICMTLRKIGLLDYKEVSSVIGTLMKDIKVTGYVDEVIDVSFIYNIVNMDKVKLYLERL